MPGFPLQLPGTGLLPNGVGDMCVPAAVAVSQGTCPGCMVGNEVTAVLCCIFHLCRIGYAHLEATFVEKGLGAGEDVSLSWCQVGICSEVKDSGNPSRPLCSQLCHGALLTVFNFILLW